MEHDSGSNKHVEKDALIPSEGSEYFGRPVIYHTEEPDTEGHMHPKPPCPDKCELGPVLGQQRRVKARDVRIQAANEEYAIGYPSHVCNGDEHYFKDRNYIASFTKALPHDCRTGEVDPEAYCALLRALDSAGPSDFEQIPLGCSHPGDDPCRPSPQRKLENPQAGYSYDMEGADCHALWMPPPPKFSSADEMAEISEKLLDGAGARRSL